MNFGDFFLATDIARELRRDAEHAALVREARAMRGGAGHASIRRLTALAFAAVSRSSAAAVRRLDDCIADDLTARLATGPRA